MEAAMVLRRMICGGITLLLSGWAIAQTAATPPAFDVASIRRQMEDLPGGRVQFLPGRFVVSHCYLKFIIQQVYGVRDFQIVDAPAWLSAWDFRWNIEAKADPAPPDAQLRLMAQTLLAERFRLKLRRETRDLPVYMLMPAKNGVKLQPAQNPGDRPGSGYAEPYAPGVMRGQNVSMADFISTLQQNLDRPVQNQTGFTAPFDFRLEWDGVKRLDSATDAAPPNPGKPSIFTAIQEQLGLRLDPQKAPYEVLVIDHVEKPGEN
jgi:uncharacterized protein (TIGR03435 family)